MHTLRSAIETELREELDEKLPALVDAEMTSAEEGFRTECRREFENNLPRAGRERLSQQGLLLHERRQAPRTKAQTSAAKKARRRAKKKDARRARRAKRNGASTRARPEPQRPAEINTLARPEAWQPAGTDTANCPQLDWREAPEVLWRSPEDEAAVADPNAEKERVERFRDRVWDRIPDRQKAVFHDDVRCIRLAWVPGREDPLCPVRGSLARLSGACRPGPGITINLAMLQRCAYPDDDLLFTLAHELAHGITISERGCVAHYARQRAAADSKAWSALRQQYEDVARLYEGPFAQCMDLGDPYDEFLADALAGIPTGGESLTRIEKKRQVRRTGRVPGPEALAVG